MKLEYVLFLSIFILLACSKDSYTTVDDDTKMEEMGNTNYAPNILLVIADDMGLDACPGYNIGSVKPNMPNLQNLIDSGIKFNNLWSNPTCTPTRAGIITGKYGLRTNVLAVDDPLSTSETSLQKYLDNNTNNEYAHAVIGKWHLSRDTSHPNDMGINYFAGFMGGGVPSYNNWTLNVNGTTSASTDYTTSKFTDLAIDWVNQQSKPWFLWLAYNAPHTPFHLPPSDLHSQSTLASDQGSIDANPLPYYMAALEALDTEMGRLINSLSDAEKENTVIIFMGDNGTPGKVAQEYNSRRAKGSIYQGGVNVPMVISGKNVSRINASEDALINTTDLYATIADIAGAGTTDVHDSKSFKGLLSDSSSEKRAYTYTENNDYTVRNATHKYIYFNNGSEALYNLSNNRLENPNLLNANRLPLSTENSMIKDELTSKLQEIRN
ncbi:MAG: sulfatase-like hydrolase/transferase [Algibacter sp.]|uniref:sulfatase-like hydrolase/transferase n=1 Tax=Algibacter sp. TaxID=1872428 RepID=UPI00261E2CA9|nr:sulfatase-like hydrolase/transferase [Algibacter sp.]MDG1729524.1 sulfatase-like hydrolase/transferase [Algibacter sp.]MDG2177732.1 sulfatase-like hydrolase/transferase [Algibacter sp.]